MIRMVALDIDGTLLDPQGQLRPAVHQAVRQALAAGVLVTLATGRRFGEAAAVATELGLELPLVLHHGTVIQDSLTGQVLYEDTLPDGLLATLVAAVRHHGQQPVLHCSPAAPHEILSGPVAGDNAAAAAYLARHGGVRRMPYGELADAPHVLSVGVYSYDDVLRPLYKQLSGMANCLATFWEPNGLWRDFLLETVHAECSKASALTHLAAQYGIGMHEVMAIGDERNDIQMIAAVGLGVAMGNAVPAVRERAKAVVASNAADGVAEAIQRFVLEPLGITKQGAPS